MKKVMGILMPSKNWEEIWKNLDSKEYFDDIKRYPIKFANKMLENKKLKILEAGVGAGNVLMFFKEKGHEIIGIDFEPNVISMLKKKYPEFDVRVGNVLKTEFEDNTFDLITLFGVIHYFEEEKQINQSLKEMFRILKPGGKICFSVSKQNLLHKLNNIKNLVGCAIKWQTPVFEHAVFTKAEIINLVSKARFKGITIEESDGRKPNILEKLLNKYWVVNAKKE